MDPDFKRFCDENCISGAQVIMFKNVYSIRNSVDDCQHLLTILGEPSDDGERIERILNDFLVMSKLHPEPALRTKRHEQLLGILEVLEE